MLFIFLCLLLIMCPIITAYMASQKGRDGILWFFIGLIFPLLALIAIMCVAPLNQVSVTRRSRPQGRTARSGGRNKPRGRGGKLKGNRRKGGKRRKPVTCPECGKKSPEKSEYCRHCGTTFGMIECPKCNAQSPSNAQFCSECGVAFPRS